MEAGGDEGWWRWWLELWWQWRPVAMEVAEANGAGDGAQRALCTGRHRQAFEGARQQARGSAVGLASTDPCPLQMLVSSVSLWSFGSRSSRGCDVARRG